jgi:hypothetical protein
MRIAGTKEIKMSTKRQYSPEEIIGKLKDAEVLTSQGHTVA